MAKTIEGILAFPRVSRNGVFYWPQELAKFDGVEVPLRFNHDKSPAGIVGKAILSYNDEKMQVKYVAHITNEEVGRLVDNHNFQVSLGALVSEPGEICHPDGTCFEAPVLKRPTEMSIVETPGMPESTLNIVEHIVQENVTTFYVTEPLKPCPEGQHQINGKCVPIEEFRHVGDECPEGQKKVDGKCVPVNNEDKHVGDCPEGQHMVAGKCVPVEEFRHADDCPEGKKMVDGKCVAINNENTSHISNHNKHLNMTDKPQEKTVEEKTKITIETDGIIVTPEVVKSDEKTTETVSKKEDCGCGHTAPTAEAPAQAEPVIAPTPAPVPEVKQIGTPDAQLEKTIDQRVDAKVNAFLEKVKAEQWTPKSEVTESSAKGKYVEESISEKKGDAILAHFEEYGYAKFEIDKDAWIESQTANLNTDTGEVTEAVVTSGTIPGVRTATAVVILPGGKIVIPVRQFGQFASIPVGQNTARFYTLSNPNFGAITEAVTTDITASTHTLTAIDITCNVRGLRQTIVKSNFEDFPAQFLNALKQQIRTEAIRDEENLILTTLGSTDNDFGNAPFHISADDGALITDTTEEDQAILLKKAGLLVCRRRLQANGYNVSPGNVVGFIHPIQYEQLLTDTNISTLIEQGQPGKSVTGIIEQYLGMQIIVTTELVNTNNAHRAIFLVKGAAFALCSQRTISIELNKEIKGQWVDIVATHRIGVDELDKNAYVIVSGPDT